MTRLFKSPRLSPDPLTLGLFGILIASILIASQQGIPTTIASLAGSTQTLEWAGNDRAIFKDDDGIVSYVTTSKRDLQVGLRYTVKVSQIINRFGGRYFWLECIT